MEADYTEGVVVAVVFKSSNCEAGGAYLGGFDQFGFALLQVGCGVDGGLSGVGEEGLCCEECEGEGDAKHSDSLNW